MSSLTLSQKHWLLHLAKYAPGPCFKVPKVTHDALVRLKYAKEVRAPLVERPGLVLTAAGIKYAKTGAQTA